MQTTGDNESAPTRSNKIRRVFFVFSVLNLLIATAIISLNHMGFDIYEESPFSSIWIWFVWGITVSVIISFVGHFLNNAGHNLKKRSNRKLSVMPLAFALGLFCTLFLFVPYVRYLLEYFYEDDFFGPFDPISMYGLNFLPSVIIPAFVKAIMWAVSSK